MQPLCSLVAFAWLGCMLDQGIEYVGRMTTSSASLSNARAMASGLWPFIINFSSSSLRGCGRKDKDPAADALARSYAFSPLTLRQACDVLCCTLLRRLLFAVLIQARMPSSRRLTDLLTSPVSKCPAWRGGF